MKANKEEELKIITDKILGAHSGNDSLRDLVKDSFQAGQSSEREDEIKFLESLELDDMDELTMQIDRKEVYLDVYLRERISKLKKDIQEKIQNERQKV